jgi:hypothetical protein
MRITCGRVASMGCFMVPSIILVGCPGDVEVGQNQQAKAGDGVVGSDRSRTPSRVRSAGAYRASGLYLSPPFVRSTVPA